MPSDFRHRASNEDSDIRGYQRGRIMMSKVTFDYSKACGFVQEHEMQYMSELAAQAKDKLLARTGAGNDFLGWIDLPVDYDKEEFARIKKAAEKIRQDSEVLLVIGIGGSYLGARAAIEFLGHSFANVVSKEIRKAPEIYYVGNSISSTYIKDLIDVIGDRDFSINMIPSPVQPQSRRSPSVYSKNYWRRSTARKKRRRGSMQPRTKREERLRIWPQKRDMRHSSCRMTWEVVSQYLPRWACFRSL